MAQWLLEKLVQLDAETWLLLAEGLLLGLAALAAQILLIYMCIAIGHLAPGPPLAGRRGGLACALRRGAACAVRGGRSPESNGSLPCRPFQRAAGRARRHPGADHLCALGALSIYFAVTNYILTRRLNLE